MLHTQDLSFAENFTDHAILQRNVEHPVWGWTKAKAKVKVTLNETTFKTRADENGRWEITLPAQVAGGPHSMYAVTGKEAKQISDLYFGDVYLLSGQSNMEWELGQSDLDNTRAPAIADPMIREITVNKSCAARPENRLDIEAPWRPGTVENISRFSAVGSYFAHYLRKEVGVPIGLLHSSWGGSRIEAWMRADILGIEEGSSMKNESLESKVIQAALKKYKADFGNSQPPTEDKGEALGYLNPETDYTQWPTITVPGPWEENGYAAVNGHFYLARHVDLTAEQAAAVTTLHLGPIDDSDWTYVNGKLVGEMYASYAKPRDYSIPAGVFKAGKNTILVRVEDTGGGGGLTAAAKDVKLSTATGDLPLAGDWHYQIGSFSVDQNRNQVPTILYNKMIHPLAGLPLTGILWYQGESNAGGESAINYEQQFKDMIIDWRVHFDREDLPFYWVQLANFMEQQSKPTEEGWAILRNSQTKALALPHTGQAVITDIGEAGDIHPKNKWEVGRRLSLHALKNQYGRPEVVASSPMVASVKKARNMVQLTFDHAPNGLEVTGDRYGYLKGFVYRNKAGEWHWGRAMINEDYPNRITVIPNAGDDITAVRYGWANNSDGNVFSKEGLPLTPFEVVVE